jgi:integrase
MRIQLLSHSGHSKGFVMAAIRKRNDRWQVQVRRKGFDPISRSFLLRADALEWAREIERQADRRELLPNKKQLEAISLRDLVIRYHDTVVKDKKSAEIEGIILKAFLREPICKRKLSDISPKDFATYRDKRLKTISPISLKRQLAPLSHMFQIAIDEWGIPLKENPLDKVKLKAKDQRRERRLRDGEHETLINAARTRSNPLIEKVVVFAIETAMRRGEILDLRWDQVDLKRRSVTILESKNGYSRTIPLTPNAVTLLQSLDRQSDRVFPLTGNALKMAWGRMLEGTGIGDLHFHDLRHEAISRFFEMGLTVPEVASISGHRDTRMLLRYAHSQMSRVYEKFGTI